MGRRSAAWLAAAVLAVWSLPAAAQQAYDFSLKDLAGSVVRLSDLWERGPVIINFWATWCLPCAKELPHLQRLADAYAARGVAVLAVSVDAPASAAGVAAFVRRYGYTMPVLLDSESRVVSLYNPRLTLPFTVLVDRGGRIAHAHQGYSPGDEAGLEEKLVALLTRPDGAPAPSPSPGLSPGVSESFLFRRFTDDGAIARRGGRTSQILNQLDLTLSRKGTLLGLRADAGLDFSPADTDLRLAKVFLEQSGRGWSARLGDFHLSLGRGMVFSVLKIFEKEGLEHVVDTTVRGGQASFGAGRWEGQVFGGWIEREEDASVRDRVAGGAVRWRAWGNARLGFNAVAAGLEPGARYASRSAGLGSLTMDIPSFLGGASFYGELSLIRRTILGSEAPVSGHGLYLQASYRTSRVGALLEVKDYRDFSFEYARPPILEAEELDILADQFDEDRSGVQAAALRLDRFWPEAEALAYVRFSWIRDAPEQHDLFGAYRRAIFHAYGGWEKKLGGGGYIHILAGWRREEADSIAFLATDGDTIHGQINASLPLGERWSLEADWKRKEFRGAEYAYSEDRAGLSLHASPRWVAALLWERSNEPSVEALTGRTRWAGAQLEWKAGTFLYLRAFLGSSKGSTKCAGGVCKALPPFTGLRLEAVLRY